MDPLFIQRTASTLEVDFNPKQGLLRLKGESYPEDAMKFFAPIQHWLNEYLGKMEPGASVMVDLDIIYFNSSSSKALMNMFDTFDEASRKGIELGIIWRHHKENEVAQECGEEFGEDLDSAKFAMMPYEDQA